MKVNDKGEKVWDLNDPQDKEAFEKMKLVDKQKDGLNLNVSVSSQEMEKLIEQKKTVEAERDDFKTRLEIAERDAFEEKRRQLGAPSNITTPEQLQGYEQALRQQNDGTYDAPLNDAQYGIVHKLNSYASPSNMIDDLLTKEQFSQNKTEKENAKQVLNQLTIKTIKGAKDGNQKGFSFPENDSVIDRLNDAYRRKIAMQRSD